MMVKWDKCYTIFQNYIIDGRKKKELAKSQCRDIGMEKQKILFIERELK